MIPAVERNMWVTVEERVGASKEEEIGGGLTCDEFSSQNPIMRPMAVISVGTVKPVKRM